MTTADQMKALLDEVNAALQQGPSGISQVITTLTTAMNPGGVIDPDSEGFDRRHLDSWGVAVAALRGAGRIQEATRVALAHYDRMCTLQVERARRFHKGTATQQTAIIHFIRGDTAVAEWFFRMAFVEDILSGDTASAFPESDACRELRVHYGKLDAFLGSLADAARATRERESGGSVGPCRWWFPEAVLVDQARARAVPIVAAQGPIPVNRVFLGLLASRLDDGGANTKGQALEDLASYLCLTLPGARLIPNAEAPDHEMDLVVVQAASGSSYLLDALGRTFLVECKNYSKAVDVEKLNHFVSKMRFHRCPTGVLFAKNGITGGETNALSAARLTQLRWYEQDGCTVIVVSGEDIQRVVTGEVTFVELLLRGYESVRFNLPLGA